MAARVGRCCVSGAANDESCKKENWENVGYTSFPRSKKSVSVNKTNDPKISSQKGISTLSLDLFSGQNSSTFGICKIVNFQPVQFNLWNITFHTLYFITVQN